MKYLVGIIVLSLSFSLKAASAGPIIHLELDYDVEESKVTDWEIGPIFPLNEKTELEMPIGQSDGQWQFRPELKRDLCNQDNCSLEVGGGLEIPLSGANEDEESNQEIELFTRVEVEISF